MGIFTKPKKGGFADVIRCDESNYLIWKWHPNGVAAGEVKRETAIRTNSVLRVKNGEVAVFVYRQKDGTLEDYIVGPFEETIKTKNFPVLSSIIGLWYEGDTPFQAEVFFINVAQAVQIRFGIPYFNIVDPRFMDFEVPVAVRGSLTFGIDDYKQFIKCHQLATFSLEDLKKKVNDTVCRYIKDAVANAPAENNIPVINIESKIDFITEKVEMKIKDRVAELFGVRVNGVEISAIELDKDSDAYLELKSVTKDLAKRQAEANVLNFEEQLRIQREEGQYAQHMATRQTNLGAYQTEVQGQVGVAGAEALGKMGENGAGHGLSGRGIVRRDGRQGRETRGLRIIHAAHAAERSDRLKTMRQRTERLKRRGNRRIRKPNRPQNGNGLPRILAQDLIVEITAPSKRDIRSRLNGHARHLQQTALQRMVDGQGSMAIKMVFLKIENRRRLERVGRQGRRLQLKRRHLHDRPAAAVLQRNFTDRQTVVSARDALQSLRQHLHHAGLALRPRHGHQLPTAPLQFRASELQLALNRYAARPASLLPRMRQRDSRRDDGQVSREVLGKRRSPVQHPRLPAQFVRQTLRRPSAAAISQYQRTHEIGASNSSA